MPQFDQSVATRREHVALVSADRLAHNGVDAPAVGHFVGVAQDD